MTGKIKLEGMRFYAFHGVFDEEQKIGGEYLIDLELEAYMSEATRKDSLEGTIDYGVVYTIVEEQMKISSKLIEHLAGRILDSLFAYGFNLLKKATVKVTKINPPLGADLKAVSVELSRGSI